MIVACTALGEISRKAALPIKDGNLSSDSDQVMESDDQRGEKFLLFEFFSWIEFQQRDVCF